MARPFELSGNWRARQQPTSSVGDHGSDDSLRSDLRPEQGSLSAATTTENIRGEDDPLTLKAIEEGRRVYVGNLPYMAKTKDVEGLFRGNGFQIEHINMSIDPYSGRNPSYCFVEFTTKAQATQAMRDLSGHDLLGRPVKLGPGLSRPQKKQAKGHIRNAQDLREPSFQRWTRTDAQVHFEGFGEQGRRLWVGGLPKMGEHATVDAGIRELFKGFEVEAVSKVVIPSSPALGSPKAWDHRYLFVDFPSKDEARRAAKATDGRYAWGVKIRVQQARGDSRKPRERDEWDDENR